MADEKTSVTGLDRLFLEVNNLEESLVFYRDHLAFVVEKENREGDPPIATVRAGSLKITLAQHLETMLKRGRGVHFFLGVASVDEFHQRLIDRGVVVAAPSDEGWGGRFVTLLDPDKYRFFFVEWREEPTHNRMGVGWDER